MKAFSWQTPEYVHREKSSDWYWVVGIVAAGIAVTAIIFGNLLLALLVAISAFVLALFASRRPQTIRVEVTDKGIHIEQAFYPFRSIRSFAIDESHHDGLRLIIESDRPLVPYVAVPIPDDEEKAEELRTFLAGRLKEEHFEENPVHLFFERIWF